MKQADAQRLAGILNNTEFMSELSDRRPKIQGTTLEEKAMSASVVEGYEKCMATITAIAHETYNIASSAYVDTRKLD